jgi:hypothetical protein
LGGKVSEPCPRCGRPISYYERKRVGHRVYVYAVHYLGYTRTPSGKIKKRVEKCYLGPEDRYIHATSTHLREGLVLRGLAARDRAIEYLDALISYLERAELDPLLARRLAERFKRLAEALEKYAEAAGAEG